MTFAVYRMGFHKRTTVSRRRLHWSSAAVASHINTIPTSEVAIAQETNGQTTDYR